MQAIVAVGGDVGLVYSVMDTLGVWVIAATHVPAASTSRKMLWRVGHG